MFGTGWKLNADPTPVGIDLAVGATAVVAGMLAVGSLPRRDLAWQCAVVAGVLGLFAMLTLDWPAVAALVPITWLLMNGFLVNRLGVLSWHGQADLDRFAEFAVAGLVGLAIGLTYRGLHDNTFTKETIRRA